MKRYHIGKEKFMIRENKIQTTSEKRTLNIPSKEVVAEQIFVFIVGFFLAKINVMGVLDTFGIAWTCVLFMNGKFTLFGFMGVLLGRTIGFAGTVDEIFSDGCIYLGVYILMLLTKNIYKGKFDGIYIVLGVVFYVVAKSALVLVYDHTLYNALYIILNMLNLIVGTYFLLKTANLFFDGNINIISQTDSVLLTMFFALLVGSVSSIKPLGEYAAGVTALLSILLSANLLGAANGTLVGTVFGIVLGLCNEIDIYTVSAFVVCGAVCGSLKKMNRFAISIIIAAVYLSLFILMGAYTNIKFITELVVSLCIFCVIPKHILTEKISAFEDMLSVEDLPTQTRSYADRIKTVCCDRMEQVCNTSAKMYKILQSYLNDTEKNNKEQFDEIAQSITDTICCHCTMGKSCAYANNNKGKKNPSCEVAKLISRLNYVGNNWRAKMVLYRRIPGIAVGCMSESIIKIKESLENSVDTDTFLSERIQSECAKICKYVSGAALVNVQNGIEVIMDLRTTSLKESEIETILKKCEELTDTLLEYRGCENNRICFVEKSKYALSTGVASVSMDKDGLCGDACTIVPFGRDGFMMAVVDGCGIGYRALSESNKVMELLETMALCGCDENSTVSLVNALMGLKSDDDKYSTADICVFNKYNGNTKFMKMGAVCSFLMQKGNVVRVDCGSGPLGIQQEAFDAVQNYRLKPNDAIIMMTDGVYDACGRFTNPDDYFIDLLKNYKITNAQELAEYIMKNALSNVKRQKDDMLVFTAIVGKRK